MNGRGRWYRTWLVVALAVGSAEAGRTVRVGVYENLPKVGLSPEGVPQGIFIDIIQAIAEEEGWPLQFVPGTWAQGLDRLRAGEIDLMPDVAPTPGRETLFAFHEEPVLSDWFQIYAPRGTTIRSVLDLQGRRVAVLQRSIQQEALASMVRGFGLETLIEEYVDYEAAFAAVARGDADAVVTNRFYGAAHAKEYRLQDTAIIFHPGGLFFAARLDGDADLLHAVDAWLMRAKRDPGSAYFHSLRRWTAGHLEARAPPWLGRVLAGAGVLLVGSLVATVAFRHRAAIRTRQLAIRTRQLDAAQHRREHAEAALRASEHKYRTLFETANDAILLMREDRFLDCNERALTLFGCARHELVGASPIAFSPPTQPDGRSSEEAARERISRALEEGPQRFEWVHTRRDGEPFFAEVSLNRLELGGETLLQAIVRDITERKRAEDEIRVLAASLERRVAERTAELVVARDQAQAADRLKSAFLATMSHELRTPLNSIIGFTGILLQELAGPLTQEQRTQLGIVRESGRHLLALVNDVLDISKIEAGHLVLAQEAFDLRASLAKVATIVKPMAERKGLRMRCECGDEVGIVTGDPRRVEQVMLNLVNNAVKFTDHGEVSIVASVEGEVVRICVTDTGMGIKQEDLQILFRPFSQIETGLARRHEGTGLGLAISKRLVELMGGTIEVASTWGKGSTFTVRLPLTRPEEAQRQGAPDGAQEGP